MERTRTTCIVRWVERGLVIVGIACLTWVGASSIRTWAYRVEQHGLARLGSTGEQTVRDAGVPVAPPDHVPGPIGRLEIPRIGLSALVMEGDDEDTLKVAVEHLPDTPLPWHEGNAALAGRDISLPVDAAGCRRAA